MSSRLPAAAAVFIAASAGCAGGGDVAQRPLPSDRPHQSLVLGHHGATDPAVAGRKDTDGQPTQLYRGPGGQLLYRDGSPVRFDSVKKQLQDLRSEEQISPVR